MIDLCFVIWLCVQNEESLYLYRDTVQFTTLFRYKFAVNGCMLFFIKLALISISVCFFQ